MGIMANGDDDRRWRLKKEKILLVTGLAMIAYETIAVGFLNQQFHGEVLLTGGGLCGLSIAQWKDGR